MKDYKQIYGSKIYFLNYEKLTSTTGEEIKNLIDWLGWNDKCKYLDYQLAPNRIGKRINSESVGVWKKYKEILLPAIDLLKKNENIKDLFVPIDS